MGFPPSVSNRAIESFFLTCPKKSRGSHLRNGKFLSFLQFDNDFSGTLPTRWARLSNLEVLLIGTSGRKGRINGTLESYASALPKLRDVNFVTQIGTEVFGLQLIGISNSGEPKAWRISYVTDLGLMF